MSTQSFFFLAHPINVISGFSGEYETGNLGDAFFAQ